jgi:hypothetical protein
MELTGQIDLCGPDLVEGWLYCDAWYNEPVTLQVYIDGQLVGECVNNIFRQDLADAGYGNGHCAFSFTVPEDLEVEEWKSCMLRVCGSPLFMLGGEVTVFA